MKADFSTQKQEWKYNGKEKKNGMKIWEHPSRETIKISKYFFAIFLSLSIFDFHHFPVIIGVCHFIQHIYVNVLKARRYVNLRELALQDEYDRMIRDHFYDFTCLSSTGYRKEISIRSACRVYASVANPLTSTIL